MQTFGTRLEFRLLALVGLGALGVGLLTWGSATGQLQIFGDTLPLATDTVPIKVSPRAVAPTSLIYADSFSTPEHNDVARTTADWNSDAGNISLKTGSISGLAQSTTIATTTRPTVVVTMEAITSLTIGSAINYAVSADGGSTWEPIFPGRAVTFANLSAADWRWRVLLERGQAGVNPTLDEIHLVFTPTS